MDQMLATKIIVGSANLRLWLGLGAFRFIGLHRDLVSSGPFRMPSWPATQYMNHEHRATEALVPISATGDPVITVSADD